VRIFGDVREMEGALRQRMDEGSSARLVAGFCWPWSDPDEDGSLVPDVAIGNWARPWNRKPKDMWRRRKGSSERPANHPYKIWATTDAGFDQVGCIYSAQGFEFDYVGLIVGRDLRWDPVSSRWMADLRQNEDVGFKSGLPSKDMAVDKLKQIYRVLATRGMKGTYLYFLDEATGTMWIGWARGCDPMSVGQPPNCRYLDEWRMCVRIPWWRAARGGFGRCARLLQVDRA
jgi:uncharacterized protein